MNVMLRLFIGLVVSVLVFIGIVHFAHIPSDRFLPPSACYDDITKQATATVTSTHERGYSDHWWAGVDYRWYADYTFTPEVAQTGPGGTVTYVQGSPVSDEIQISDDWYKYLQNAQNNQITVSYDPFNPSINGVHGTVGRFSKSCGWLSPWLWYPIGVIVGMILIGEVLKRWIKQGDI